MRPGRIFTLIERLSQKYLSMGKVSSPPVPITLADLCGRNMEIRLVPLKAYHGAIWHVGNSWIMHINANEPPAMRRLTIFHEAFHMLAHCKGTPVFKRMNTEKGAFNEALAENFAYHVLMPRNWVESKWAEVKDPGSLAKYFDVPEDTMYLRLRSLHLL